MEVILKPAVNWGQFSNVVEGLAYIGANNKMKSLTYEIETAFPIVDYLPKTTMTSLLKTDVKVKDVEMETRVSQEGVNVQYSLYPLSGEIKAADESRNSQRSEYEYSLKNPHQPLVSSGTGFRGNGVFFTYETNSEVTLKGQKDIAILLRVPKSFQADYLTVKLKLETLVEMTYFSSSSMQPKRFYSKFDVAFYDSSNEKKTKLYEMADRFINNREIDKVHKRLRVAQKTLKEDQRKRWLSSSPKYLQRNVEKLQNELGKLRKANKLNIRSLNGQK
ncbi:hypothetical protein OAG56_03550 [Mariniblastus sp.]|nr:hypothetical protein [Mariniblastus sp.]MDB4756423.1 hypothetical protein [Mariniblastus sp.]